MILSDEASQSLDSLFGTISFDILIINYQAVLIILYAYAVGNYMLIIFTYYLTVTSLDAKFILNELN